MTDTPDNPVHSLVGWGKPRRYDPSADECRATAYELVQEMEVTGEPTDHLEGIAYALLAISADLAAIRAHLTKEKKK